MRRADSFEKTLMLGKIEGRRRKGSFAFQVEIMKKDNSKEEQILS